MPSDPQQRACKACFNLTCAGAAAQARLKALSVEERVHPAMAVANAMAHTKRVGQNILDKLPTESADERDKLGQPPPTPLLSVRKMITQFKLSLFHHLKVVSIATKH